MEKWIDDETETEFLQPMPYLSKTVVEKVKVFSKDEKLTKNIRERNRLKRTILGVSEEKSAIWNFLRFIIRKDFSNYVFMCDTDLELATILR